MLRKKMLIISTVAVALTIAGQANADVTIVHNADGGSQVQAGTVKISTSANGSSLIETGSVRLSTDGSFLVGRRYKPRRPSKLVIPTIKYPSTRIPSIPVVRFPNLKIPVIPSTGATTVIQRNETYRNGGVYSTRTSTRSSNGSSSNSQSTVIRGDGHSNTNSNYDLDD